MCVCVRAAVYDRMQDKHECMRWAATVDTDKSGPPLEYESIV